MKNLLVALFLMLIALGLNAQQKGYTITAHITGLADHSKVFLMQELRIDSTEAMNGSFHFKGQIKEHPPALLILYNTENLSELNVNRKEILLDAAAIYCTGIAGNLRKAVIKSRSSRTQDHESFITYFQVLDGLASKFEQDNNNFKAFKKTYYANSTRTQAQNEENDKWIRLTTKNAKILDSLKLDMTLDYVKKHPSSHSGLDQVFSHKGQIPTAKLSKLYKQMDSHVRLTKNGKSLGIYINSYAASQIGSQAVNFTLKDILDKPVSLSDYRGKYVLLEFWGSWCSPCRWQNPMLNEAYEKYKSFGFEIVGMGMDNKADLVSAINMDKIKWRNLVIPSQFNAVVVNQYRVSVAPSNFLIDPLGKIIAKDLYDDGRDGLAAQQSLSGKLKEIFHN